MNLVLRATLLMNDTLWAIPAKVDVVLEIVIRAVPGAFVRVSLSSVALLTGTHLGVPFRLNFA